MPNLTTGGLGIQRHRAKGAARPDQLWDALNCIVRDDGTVEVLRTVADAPVGASLRVRVSDGAVTAIVTGEDS